MNTAIRPASVLARAALLGLLLASLVGFVLLVLFASSRPQPRDFWAAFDHSYLEVEHFDDLATMADAADAVVLGTIGDIQLGRVFGSEGDWVQYASATVNVSRVLRGALPEQHSDQVILEIMLPSTESLDAARSLLPQPRSVFFLRNKGVEAERYGYPEVVQATESGFYRLIAQRGVVADAAGRVTAPGWADGPDFLSALEGTSFDEFVASLRN